MAGDAPTQDDPRTLVSTDWLSRHLGDDTLRILDASWYLPAMERDARAEFDAAHIPGARFFDIDAIADHRSGLPHMAPPPEMFVSRVRGLGIGDGQQVVVYDGAGLFSAARVWWLFRLMGKDDVAVLDGGLPKWTAEDRPLTSTRAQVRDRHLTVHHRPHLLSDVTDVAQAAKARDRQVVDARSPARFRGEEPEPRAGMRAGHVPGSLNVHYSTLLNADGTMKDADGLRAAFEAGGVDLSRPIITTCGSGVTAAILSLALARLGHEDNSLYDGSWSEWGAFPELEVETG
ncbi:3-mercaptopyruvate sulfurtransferase [Tropicimonas sp. IMCC34011]|uniref:3-mercaptopyruvate sulfurtransferase n=1 Tax=Tropicimonas sp. IMCC34011 TaxID=2248759 RepID=UPI000E28837E|nr:3-mercaptopyruvate sulfurtransferase [Tropicimonas sp. IMCC34011]